MRPARPAARPAIGPEPLVRHASTEAEKAHLGATLRVAPRPGSWARKGSCDAEVAEGPCNPRALPADPTAGHQCRDPSRLDGDFASAAVVGIADGAHRQGVKTDQLQRQANGHGARRSGHGPRACGPSGDSSGGPGDRRAGLPEGSHESSTVAAPDLPGYRAVEPRPHRRGQGTRRVAPSLQSGVAACSTGSTPSRCKASPEAWLVCLGRLSRGGQLP